MRFDVVQRVSCLNARASLPDKRVVKVLLALDVVELALVKDQVRLAVEGFGLANAEIAQDLQRSRWRHGLAHAALLVVHCAHLFQEPFAVCFVFKHQLVPSWRVFWNTEILVENDCEDFAHDLVALAGHRALW